MIAKIMKAQFFVKKERSLKVTEGQKSKSTITIDTSIV